jgi:hypothetical protein
MARLDRFLYPVRFLLVPERRRTMECPHQSGAMSLPLEDRIAIDGCWTLGTVDTEAEAARAYKDAVIRLHGEFARLNVLPGAP